jgi:hypothetical protein
MKSSLSLKGLSVYKISGSHTDWCKFSIHLRSFKIQSSPYSKGLLKKIIIQIKIVDVSKMFRCTKPRLSECNSSQDVTIKQNNFKFQAPSCSFFFFPEKNSLIKLVQNLMGGGGTDRMVIALVYIFPLGRKVSYKWTKMVVWFDIHNQVSWPSATYWGGTTRYMPNLSLWNMKICIKLDNSIWDVLTFQNLL